MTTTTGREELRVDGLPEPVSHYTDAVRWGDLLFVSGCAAIGPDGRVVAPGDVAAQARVVHEYLGAALRAGGTDFANVLKVTVYLIDMGEFAAVNEVYGSFFEASPPARVAIGVSQLPRGARVEMDAIVAL